MIAIQLDLDTERRLERLAKLTGRTAASLAREAIVEYLEDHEDGDLAKRRLKTPGRTFLPTR